MGDPSTGEDGSRIIGVRPERRGAVELTVSGAPRRRAARQRDELPVPRQLKVPEAHFTNRADELAQLDRILDEARARPTIQVIHGPGGIGKTALAEHWMYRVRARFPRGQLRADLGAFGPKGPVDTGELLGQFLLALRVPPERMPFDVEERAALYRSLTADTPLLVLLDNADSAAQVRPLIPAAAASVVVVTTRRRLGELAVRDGARLLQLTPFTGDHGRELLHRALGADRIRPGDLDADKVVRLCAGLPLALYVTATRLTNRPQLSLTKAAVDLERRRLGVLSDPAKEDLSVEATFDLSYEALPAEAARLYRALGAHPGAEFGSGVAAAAVDATLDEVERLLDQLIEVGLLDEVEEDRYSFHDLVRLHALRKAQVDGTEADRDTALRRMLEWYLRAALTTEHLVTPDQDPIPYDYAFRAPDPATLPDRAESLDWLERERINLVAAVQAALEHELPELGWQLAAAMWPLFLLHKHYRDFLAVSEFGVRCARQMGDASAEALMLNRSGAACRGAGRFDEAIGHYTRGLAAGDPVIAIRSVEGLGLVALAQGRLDDALGHFEEDLRRSTELDRPHDIGLALINLGSTLTKADRAGEAIERLTRAQELLAACGDEYNVARARTDLGRALGRDGRTALAAEHLTAALAIMADRGSRFEQARILQVLGEVAEVAGEVEEARRHYGEALPILEELGRPEADQVRKRLNLVR
ncbi:tetratricopeptide repeat protein [Amycolatopsis anabasis]|uniref:tetratricopeptide repeat protein n=1 Tax=Amycolatopsis anabasis TaxID=1840409 RepID=UPI00131E9BF9|nr:tetratricopeptide repeat protein [Amycolatopsis anabasis]